MFTSTPNGDIIMCIIVNTNTQCDVYILNFADTLHTVQLEAYTGSSPANAANGQGCIKNLPLFSGQSVVENCNL